MYSKMMTVFVFAVFAPVFASCTVGQTIIPSEMIYDDDVDWTGPPLQQLNVPGEKYYVEGNFVKVKIFRAGLVVSEANGTISNAEFSIDCPKPTGGWASGVNYTIKVWVEKNLLDDYFDTESFILGPNNEIIMNGSGGGAGGQ